MLSEASARAEVARAEWGSPILVEDTCSDTCTYQGDGQCDDGGTGHIKNRCEFGTDCEDCGIRIRGEEVPVPSMVLLATEPYKPFVFVSALAGLLLICCLFSLKNSYPANYLVLLAFTLTQSYTVGFCCIVYGIVRSCCRV